MKNIFASMECREVHQISHTIQAIVQICANLAGAVCHDRADRAGTSLGREVLVNLWLRCNIMRPDGKGIDPRASALVVVARILDGNGKLVLLGKLQTPLNVPDVLGVNIIVWHSTLKASAIDDAS